MVILSDIYYNKPMGNGASSNVAGDISNEYQYGEGGSRLILLFNLVVFLECNSTNNFKSNDHVYN